ncbi:methylated-DNA--[protein]-cysteine S-methyltransferase [Tabrizicola sp.]|jgi:methylated-DNA-[protein]-cysteine S-methyltransferase|uniref:methylated-DNA--[protein]-cysteine S-methyltransferase n=1 Tax=Tabrizicola sp. TaxID=2005166 RepID=UPI000BD764AA|nr:methylated-DNA--[protein]-cysteine S-methyltransferase [Tabrizicola sp.]MBY0351022.1 methylated-DNA--[protein]-cysteine S-methyltransferase [Tabrizicola sp.]OYX19158.1 MAG: cysteine methyltransferase [Rhodobacterales bacterium 32-66-9]
MIRAGMTGRFGPVSLVEHDGRLVALDWRLPEVQHESPLLAEGLAQLAAYFDGRLGQFDLPLEWGTGLNESVRRAMAAIPMGETRSYGQIARVVGAPARAVGQACGANPLPILIPCHRVTGTGWFGGFSAPGGVETKAALLRHEGALML